MELFLTLAVNKEIMRSPICIINTDDSISMNSELRINVEKTLNRIKMTHETQGGSEEIFYVSPHQVDEMIKFLGQTKEWINSGYKEKERPESYTKERIF